jgi:hypothetical protein
MEVGEMMFTAASIFFVKSPFALARSSDALSLSRASADGLRAMADQSVLSSVP